MARPPASCLSPGFHPRFRAVSQVGEASIGFGIEHGNILLIAEARNGSCIKC